MPSNQEPPAPFFLAGLCFPAHRGMVGSTEQLFLHLGRLRVAGSAWPGAGCAARPDSEGGGAGSHRTWLRPIATLFFSRSSAWKSSSMACGEGARHGAARKHPVPQQGTHPWVRGESLAWGRRCCKPFPGISQGWRSHLGHGTDPQGQQVLLSLGPRASTLPSPPCTPAQRHGAPEGLQEGVLPQGVSAAWAQSCAAAASFLPAAASLPPLSPQACPQSTRQGLGGTRRDFPDPSEKPALTTLSFRLTRGSSSQKYRMLPQGNKHFPDK